MTSQERKQQEAKKPWERKEFCMMQMTFVQKQEHNPIIRDRGANATSMKSCPNGIK